MKLGLGLGLTKGRAIFNPALLFGASTAGAFYDPSDLSSMYQDSAGTTPAAVNSPVGRINDKSGRGNHATQATAAARPILRQDSNGKYYLDFDGVDDFLRAAFAIAQPWDRVSAIRQLSRTGDDRIFGGGSATSGLLYQRALLGSPGFSLYDGVDFLDNAGSAIGANAIVTERHSGASSRLAVNNDAYTTGNPGAVDAGGITIGAEHTGTNAANIRLYGVVMIGRPLTDAETTQLRNYFAQHAGVTL